MAKPLANGYPIGAILLRDAIGSTMTPGMSDCLPTRWDACADIVLCRDSWNGFWRIAPRMCHWLSCPQSTLRPGHGRTDQWRQLLPDSATAALNPVVPPALTAYDSWMWIDSRPWVQGS